jgi:hypothetical protein
MRVRGRDAALLLISGTDYHRYVTRYRLLYEFHESTNAAPHPTLPDFTPILKIQTPLDRSQRYFARVSFEFEFRSRLCVLSVFLSLSLSLARSLFVHFAKERKLAS